MICSSYFRRHIGPVNLPTMRRDAHREQVFNALHALVFL